VVHPIRLLRREVIATEGWTRVGGCQDGSTQRSDGNYSPLSGFGFDQRPRDDDGKSEDRGVVAGEFCSYCIAMRRKSSKRLKVAPIRQRS
jgi:hypothetical protein